MLSERHQRHFLFLLQLLFKTSVGFTTIYKTRTSSVPFVQRASYSSSNGKTSIVRLDAKIFGENGEWYNDNNNNVSGEYSNGQSHKATTSSSSGISNEDVDNDYTYSALFDFDHQPLINAIADRTDSVAMLARMSVAFCPQGHLLNLHQLAHVSLLDVDDVRLQMQAVMCDDQNCVTLHIPVNFPHSCFGSEDMVECVLDNFYQLDEYAKVQCERVEMIQNSAEDYQHSQRELLELQQVDNLEYPAWWIQPSWDDADYQQECQTLRSLLNEPDFQGELISFINQVFVERGETCTAQQVAVGAIGPAGIVFRTLQQPQETEQHSNQKQSPPQNSKQSHNNDDDESESEIVIEELTMAPSKAAATKAPPLTHQRDVSLSFGNVANDSTSLRNVVLDIFDG